MLQNCHNQFCSHAETNSICCGARLHLFFKVPIQKGLSRILDNQERNNRGSLWFPLTPVALVVLSNGPRQLGQNWLHLFSFPHSDCMDMLTCSKIQRCHTGLGTLPKEKIAVPLWYSALQLGSKKEARCRQLGLESAQIKSAGHRDSDHNLLQGLPS